MQPITPERILKLLSEIRPNLPQRIARCQVRHNLDNLVEPTWHVWGPGVCTCSEPTRELESAGDTVQTIVELSSLEAIA